MLREKLDIEIPMSSYEAAKAVLDLGGKLRLVYYTELGIRTIVKPEKWTERNMPLPRPVRPSHENHLGGAEKKEEALAGCGVSVSDLSFFCHVCRLSHTPNGHSSTRSGMKTDCRTDRSPHLRRCSFFIHERCNI